MSVAESDYSKEEPRGECMFRRCTRPVRDPERHMDMCEFHYAIWEADGDGCEAASAAQDIIPAMAKLAVAACNDYLYDELEKLRVKSLDYAERRYLDYEMLHTEEKMNLEEE